MQKYTGMKKKGKRGKGEEKIAYKELKMPWISK
jgi:hypothetical protein